MKTKTKIRLRSKKGFTLVELVVVIAIAALILAVAAAGIMKAREAAAMSSEGDRLRQIQAGLTEYKMYKGAFPLQAANSTTWPAALGPYILTDYVVGGTYPHGYKCDAVSKSITVETPVQESAISAGNIMAKLQDQGLCDSTSAITAANAIDCVIVTFKANAGCE